MSCPGVWVWSTRGIQYVETCGNGSFTKPWDKCSKYTSEYSRGSKSLKQHDDIVQGHHHTPIRNNRASGWSRPRTTWITSCIYVRCSRMRATLQRCRDRRCLLLYTSALEDTIVAKEDLCSFQVTLCATSLLRCKYRLFTLWATECILIYLTVFQNSFSEGNLEPETATTADTAQCTDFEWNGDSDSDYEGDDEDKAENLPKTWVCLFFMFLLRLLVFDHVLQVPLS